MRTTHIFLFALGMWLASVPSLLGDELVLLRFRADWCAPCVQQKQEFNRGHMADYLKRVHVRDVYIDVDKNPEAVRKWKVTTVPCTILVSVDEKNDGRTLRRLGGSKDNPHKHMSVTTYQRFVTPPNENRSIMQR